MLLIFCKQEHVLSGGHGLMVQGYHPVIQALAKDIDIRLNHRYSSFTTLNYKWQLWIFQNFVCEDSKALLHRRSTITIVWLMWAFSWAHVVNK